MARWTKDRSDEAIRRWLAGDSATQIARNMGGGLTKNAIIGRLHRLGIGNAQRDEPSQVKRPWTRNDDASAIALRAEGLTSGQIAAELRRGKDAVRSHFVRLTRHGVTLPKASSKRPSSPMGAIAMPNLDPPLSEPAKPSSSPITILDLTDCTCRWPLWSGAEPRFYCGAAHAPGEGPYCVEHRKSAVNPVSLARSQRRADMRHTIAAGEF